MQDELTGFEVVFIARASGRLQVLDDASDADAATVAFHDAQEKLRRAGEMGELVLLDKTNTRRLLLREAVRARPAQAHPHIMVSC